MLTNRKIFLVALLLMTTLNYAESQNKFAVSGEVKFSSDGDIRIGVYTQKAWSDPAEPTFTQGEPAFTQVIKLTSKQKEAKKVHFRIEGIPKDTYVIYSYQDIDGDGKPGRIDPWGTYRDAGFAPPVWDKVKFELDRNISGIEIELFAM